MIPAAIKPNTTLHPPPVKSNASIEPGMTPPPITNRSPAPPPSKSVQKKLVKPPEPQRYKYFIRFTSGGSMTANDVRVDGDRVTLIVDKGYEVSMSKVDIASIQRQKK